MEILFSLLSFLVNLHLPLNSFSKHTAHDKGLVVIILFRTSLTCNTFVFLSSCLIMPVIMPICRSMNFH